jgi:hypothetical protein
MAKKKKKKEGTKSPAIDLAKETTAAVLESLNIPSTHAIAVEAPHRSDCYAPLCLLPMCAACMCTTPPSGGFKACGSCKSHKYCDRECQLFDWKHFGHNSTCGKPMGITAQHKPSCTYSHRNPQVGQQTLVQTSHVQVHPSQLVTTGLNTCIYVVVKTRRSIIGWHASSENVLGDNMGTVRAAFQKVNSSQGGVGRFDRSGFVRGFIVPGVDRDDNLDLRLDCRSMLMHPWIDPTQSRRFVRGVLAEFDWGNKLEILASPQSYKDFVVCDAAHAEPYTFSDVAMFDDNCTYDGETAAVKSRGMF